MPNDGWLRAGVFYRVDPRLFRDGDGDGVGDLRGLAAGVGYLRWLGADAVWPAFDALPPDSAYDGLLPVASPTWLPLANGDAWRRLVAEAHRAGLRLTIDRWAEACRVCRDGGLALDAAPSDQPLRAVRSDLALRAAFAGGIDAVWAGDGWALPGPDARPPVWTATAPVAERATVAIAVSPARFVPLLDGWFLDPGAAARTRRPDAADATRSLTAALLRAESAWADGAAPYWTLMPPGAPRLAEVAGAAWARALAVLLLSLPGVAVLAAGDEIGLVDGISAGFERTEGHPGPAVIERAPIPWEDGPGAGFAPPPWRPLADGGAPSVARQRRDPDSMLALHRRAVALRRCEPALAGGAVAPIAARGGLLAVLREAGRARFLVALNLGEDPAAAPLGRSGAGHVALATDRRREGARVVGELRLAGGEAAVVRLSR